MSTQIRPCLCAHKDQDTRYGKGRRVFNKTKKGYRCTVCGKEPAIEIKTK